MEMWLDDKRPPPHKDAHVTWVVTAEDAIALLETGQVTSASLDHDLGLGKTGYDVVCWMEEHDAWPERGVRVHSMNPVGRQRMESVIERAYERRDEKEHLAYDITLMQPGCVLLQAALGCNPHLADKFPPETWLLSPTCNMQVYEVTDEELAVLVKCSRPRRQI